MSSTSTNSRLSVLKSKVVTLAVQEVKVPDRSTDVLDLFQSNTGAHCETSNQWTIDVFPNFVPILMYVMLMSLKHANMTQHRDHSLSSVATICMYHMTVVYGFFLLNDLFVRPSPSAHARSWSGISWKHDFATFLLSLPMPEFLAPILSQFHCFQTERTKNVFFVPSAAGYDHDQFFGRVFPLNMFAAIHDSTAILSGNSSRYEVLQDLYSRVLYTVQNPAFSCVIPDLIGITIDQTTPTQANYMNSKLYQVFSYVFNPALFCNFQHRSSVATLSFIAPHFPTNQINAYDYLFSASSANLRQLKVVLQAVSAILTGTVPCKMTLNQFITESTSPSILKHGYSTFALPTWSHSENDTKSSLFNVITAHTLVSEDSRAEDICFLQCPAQNGSPCHDNEDLVSFIDSIHTAPSVLVLDTDGGRTISAHLPLLAGKIIESFELDGSTIEMPNCDKRLGLQNCMFADSAISYKYVRPGSHFHPRNVNSVLPPLARAQPNSRPRLPASTLLHDRTMIMLPTLNSEINKAVVPPGMTLRTPVNVLRYAQSFIGFKTVDATSNDDAVPGMLNDLLLVWSPYTYNPCESDDYPTPALDASRHYFLTNLRTIFGTDYNLVKTKHPYEALPVT